MTRAATTRAATSCALAPDEATSDAARRLATELQQDALFDEGVEAARNACVAGASIASAAMTAAAWYDNPLTGAPAVVACIGRVAPLPLEAAAWRDALRPAPHSTTGDIFTPGFGFVQPAQAAAVIDACRRLVDPTGGARSRIAFFLEHRTSLAAVAGPLNQAGLAALFFADHGVGADDAERCFLLARMEAAIAEAQRARRGGVKAFPFFSEAYVYEGERPATRTLDVAALMKEVGLE